MKKWKVILKIDSKNYVYSVDGYNPYHALNMALNKDGNRRWVDNIQMILVEEEDEYYTE